MEGRKSKCDQGCRIRPDFVPERTNSDRQFHNCRVYLNSNIEADFLPSQEPDNDVYPEEKPLAYSPRFIASKVSNRRNQINHLERFATLLVQAPQPKGETAILGTC